MPRAGPAAALFPALLQSEVQDWQDGLAPAGSPCAPFSFWISSLQVLYHVALQAWPDQPAGDEYAYGYGCEAWHLMVPCTRLHTYPRDDRVTATATAV